MSNRSVPAGHSGFSSEGLLVAVREGFPVFMDNLQQELKLIFITSQQSTELLNQSHSSFHVVVYHFHGMHSLISRFEIFEIADQLGCASQDFRVPHSPMRGPYVVSQLQAHSCPKIPVQSSPLISNTDDLLVL